MKSKKFLFVLFLLLQTDNIFPQDTSITRYFPMHVGNTWVYYWDEYRYSTFMEGMSRYRIVGSEFINGKTYFDFNIQTTIQGLGIDLFPENTLRIDSNSCNVYFLQTGGGCNYSINEISIDSLRAEMGDSLFAYCGNEPMVCTDTFEVLKFGALRDSKKFYFHIFERYYMKRYLKNIGLDTLRHIWNFTSYDYFLQGCVIEGTVYGDTSMPTGINPISEEVPQDFCLYQNYPNPFNPVTTIKFDVADLSAVTIKIYDASGNEISILVNESRVSPGSYQVSWDASGFASGVYFYKLTAGGFSKTVKMVLLK